MRTLNCKYAVCHPSGRPSNNLCLYPQEYICVDDRLMAAFHIVFRSDSVICYSFLIESVYCVSLLEKRITDVLLVGQYLPDIAFVPFQVTRTPFFRCEDYYQ